MKAVGVVLAFSLGINKAEAWNVAHAALVMGAGSSEGNEHVGTGKVHTVPPLRDVASDKRFFGPPFPADYPEDHQPKPSKKLFEKGQPYPKVQEQGFFDKDYVKDENSDGGEWQAQMDYDTARSRIEKAVARKKDAQKRHEAGSKVVTDAQKKYEAKKEEEDKAAEAEAAAESRARKEKRRAQEQEGMTKEEEEQKKEEEAAREAARKTEQAKRETESAKETVERHLKEAREALGKEREDFKGCQRELDEAKAKVDSLQREMEDMKNSHTDESVLLFRRKRELEEQQKLIHEQEAKTHMVEVKRDEALARLAAVRNETKTAQKELEKETTEYQAAQRKAKKEEQDLEEAEEELGGARTQLRQARGDDALPYHEEKPAPPKVERAAAAPSSRGLSLRSVFLVGAILVLTAGA